jgi:ribosomal protein S16
VARVNDIKSDADVRKKAIFDSMSPRRRKHIEKIGYHKWDPFEEPKDPIDIRRDKTNRTAQQLVREFLQNCGHAKYSNAYGRGVLEMALGIVNDDDRFIGMYEFVSWYKEQLKNVEK